MFECLETPKNIQINCLEYFCFLISDEKELKRKMDTNAHLFLPMYGREEIDIYQDNFQFVLVANNPGSILLVKKVLPESITKSITELVLKIWPVLLVVVLMGSICGTLLWMAVTISHYASST